MRQLPAVTFNCSCVRFRAPHKLFEDAIPQQQYLLNISADFIVARTGLGRRPWAPVCRKPDFPPPPAVGVSRQMSTKEHSQNGHRP